MADSKISALTDGSPLVSTDILVIARSGANYKIPASKLPGYELNYTEITSAINVTSTTEASGTTILSPGAITFDGGPVICEVFAWITTPNASPSFAVLSLFEGATQVTRLGISYQSTGSNIQSITTICARYRFTPSSGSHTYTVTAYANSTSGTPAVSAGSGGTSGSPPAFIRFTKV